MKFTYQIQLVLIATFLLFSCEKKDEGENSILPIVVTTTISEVAENSAKITVEVSTNGGSELTQRGIYWSLGPNPGANDNIVLDSGLGNTFSVILENLDIDTRYYVRSFATNETGTSAGAIEIFSTLMKTPLLTKQFVYRKKLHNPEENLIYIFSRDDYESESFLISAFNYTTEEITNQQEIAFGEDFEGGSHAIGVHNNNTELYVTDFNSLKILDGSSLNEMQRFTIDSQAQISDIVLKNGLLFISTFFDENFDQHLFVYDRNTLNMISKEEVYVNGFKMAVYDDTTADRIVCVGFPSGSSNLSVYEYFYNYSGDYLSQVHHQFATTGGEPILTDDSIDFILKNETVYPKNDISDGMPILNDGIQLWDYAFDENVEFLYLLGEIGIIKIYNTSNFNFEGEIETQTQFTNRSIFIKNNKANVISYSASPPIKVYFDSYEIQ